MTDKFKQNRNNIFKEFQIADTIAMQSKDPSSQIGAVIVSPDRTIRCTGYNGFGINDPDLPEEYADRSIKYEKVIHAEDNAIKNLLTYTDPEYLGVEFYLFVNAPPCDKCAQKITDAGIKKVYYLDRKMSLSFEAVKEKSTKIFKDAGIEATAISNEEYLDWLKDNQVNPLVNGIPQIDNYLERQDKEFEKAEQDYIKEDKTSD